MPIPAGGVIVQGYDEPTIGMEVLAAFGADLTADPTTWSWTDLSSRLRAVPISMRAGKSGGAGRVSPGTCSVTLDNDDSALTPLHPMSPYWPDVELGTPVRVRLRRVEDPFDRTGGSGWGTAPSGHVWSGYGAGGSVLGGDQAVSGGRAHQSVPVSAAYRTSWLPGLSLLDCQVHLSGVSLPFSGVTGGPVEPGNILLRAQSLTTYYLARVEVTTTEAVVCRLYGPTGALLASATVPGLTHTAAQKLEVVAEIVGDRLGMKVWATGGIPPTGWTVTATDSTLALPGGIGVRTGVAAGNTNTKPVIASYSSVTVRVDRFSGFADQWEPTYLPTGVVGEMSSAVRITCSGILRRIQQGQELVRSAMRRAIDASGPAAYWPLEDGLAASLAGSAIPGGPPMTVTGGSEFVAIQDSSFGNGPTLRYGTSTLLDLSGGGSVSAVMPTAVTVATATAWTAYLGSYVDTATVSGDVVLLELDTPGGTYVRWQLVLRAVDNRTQVVAYNAAGTATTVIDAAGGSTSFEVWDLSVWQSGGNINVGLFFSFGSYGPTGSVPGTLTGVTAVRVNPTRATQPTEMPFGHVAIWGQQPAPVDALFFDGYGTMVSGSPLSWNLETAHDRLARLAAEDGITLHVPAVDADAVTRMGWQEPSTSLDLYQDCEDADGGILHESGYGLAYLPRTDRYNKPVDLTIDLATYAITAGSGEVLDPVYDDRGIRNQWTVERRDGSSAVAGDPVSQRRGVYRDSVELNLADDSQLPDQASWRLHLSSVVDLREASFPIDLAANPDLIDGWLSCGVGSRIVRVNPPAQYGPGPLDRLVAGWTETIGPRSWMVQVMPEPASPWDVAEVDGVQRVAADGSVTIGLSSSATTMLLSSTVENGWWTEDASDFPLDMRVGGERVTASSIARPLVDPFFRTVAGGWGAPWTVSLGDPADVSVNGSTGLIAVDVVNDERHMTTELGARTQDVRLWALVPAAPTGAPINVGVLLRWVDPTTYVWADAQVNTDSSITLRLIKRVSGVATVLASVVSGVAHSTSVPLALRAETNGTLLRARVWSTADSEPSTWQASAVDDGLPTGIRGGVIARRAAGNTNGTVTVQFDNISVQQPQLVTLSARGVNGVQRAWPAGTAVDVWRPAVAAL